MCQVILDFEIIFIGGVVRVLHSIWPHLYYTMRMRTGNGRGPPLLKRLCENIVCYGYHNGPTKVATPPTTSVDIKGTNNIT